jgi:RNA polymerase sigma-70 factor, ECF subfamily
MDDSAGGAIADSMEHEPGDLHQAFEESRAAWPGIEVAFAAFEARMARAQSLASAADVYLACACSEANPLAIVEFERRFIARVREVVVRVDPSYDFIAEVEQILRERLLVGPAAKIRDYSGSGSLAGWVRTAALRTALNLRRSSSQRDRQARSLEPFEHLLDPEVAFLRQRYAPEVDQALRRALTQLDPDDRLLLTFYYVDGLTLSRIAALQRVGTTTVFRRLSAAGHKVLARVRNDLAGRLQLSGQGLDSLLRLVVQDIDLNISQFLAGD